MFQICSMTSEEAIFLSEPRYDPYLTRYRPPKLVKKSKKIQIGCMLKRWHRKLIWLPLKTIKVKYHLSFTNIFYGLDWVTLKGQTKVRYIFHGFYLENGAW